MAMFHSYSACLVASMRFYVIKLVRVAFDRFHYCFKPVANVAKRIAMNKRESCSHTKNRTRTLRSCLNESSTMIFNFVVCHIDLQGNSYWLFHLVLLLLFSWWFLFVSYFSFSFPLFGKSHVRTFK